ncbi:MAG TPA: zinc ribbon domain-containing protein [Longimicrobiales bacterium]|nr:zinc ribbon domain-containing protein [Longimicrobiales bacterium]
MQCPSCNAESHGAYCPECGTPLRAECKECGTSLVPGARFCTACGAPVRRGAANLPWYLAGAALVVLIVLVLIPTTRRSAPPSDDGAVALQPGGAAPAAGDMAPAGMPGAAPGSAGAPGPLTGTPRELADRLFNRIMQLRESGDTARARFFLPMGMQAYAMAGDLDADGLYHLSLLQGMAGNGAEGRATAEKILATSPDHLLALAAAAEAASVAGDRTAARAYYKRLVDHYDAESKKPLPEYQEHQRILAEYRAEADAYLKR